MSQSRFVCVFIAALACAALAPALRGQDATVPGEVSTPYPTLTNLSVEWRVQGDDNLNGRVSVRFRATGETEWREAMPLVRIPAGNSGNRTTPTFYWDNRHSGSIFDLRPDTGYEIRLRLEDPDGGSAERTVRARTRPVPRPAPGAREVKVNPRTFKQAAAAAEPGDILLLSPGYYEHFTATRDGAPGKPVVIRGTLGQPIPSAFDSIGLQNRKHLILEKLTVRGTIDLLGAEDVAVRYCNVHAKFGIVAKSRPGAKNCYIADNVVSWVMPWVAEGMGAGSIYEGPGNVGEGIEMTGPGNVICHNRVTGFRDCISTMEDRSTFDQVSIDIYGNDIYTGADDGVECDFCMGNCRVVRNRLTNCFMGLSSQPSLGGPMYFIRNAMYNIIEAPFKFCRGSSGNVTLHNTVVKVGDGFRIPHGPGEYSRSLFRNNLAIGGPGGGRYGRYSSGSGRAFYTPETDPTNDFDYDGIGVHELAFSAGRGRSVFAGLDELRSAVEKHGIRAGLDVFLSPVAFPHPAVPERGVPDLRLRPGSAAEDRGVPLANVNDGFRGSAPDLGAYETGDPLPHYGPRPEGVDEETSWLERNRKP